MNDDCLFCRIIAGEVPSTEVYADDELYAFRDIHPCAPTHVLVVPRKHIPKLSEAVDEDAQLLGTLLLTAARIAKAEGLTDYRLVNNCGSSAGQSVFHVHLHLIGGRPFSWPPG